MQTPAKLDFSIPVFYAFYIVLNAMMAFLIMNSEVGGVAYDFLPHNAWAMNIVENGFDLSNLYHNGVAFLVILGICVNRAAGILVFIMQMLFVVAIHYVVWKLLKDYVDGKWIIFVVAVVALAGSIPNLLGPNMMYHFAFGINVWHNPTTFTVMPFAILSFFFFCRTLAMSDIEKPKRTRNILGVKCDDYLVSALFLSLTLLLSVYGKVSWLPPFAVAALIFLFCWWLKSKFNLNRLKDCFFIGCCFIPAGVLALWITTNTVYAEGYFSIQLAWFIRPTIVLNLLFPLLVLCVRYNEIRNNRFYQVAWLTYVAALLQSLFIVQHPLVYAGNITWGVLYSLTVLLLISSIEFVKYIHQSKIEHGMTKYKLISYIGLSLMGIHLFSGIYYALHVYTFNQFWF